MVDLCEGILNSMLVVYYYEMKPIKFNFFLFVFLASYMSAYSQGKNHRMLVGYDIALFDTNVTSTKAQLLFDSTSLTVVPQNFKMPFRAAQANICDESGRLLMVTNGCWIADATGDTMQNGGGLNPGSFTDDWCDNTSGNPFVHVDVILPWPDDTSKYILIHQIGSYTINGATELYYSVIDMRLNGGLGAVTQKNMVIISGSLNVGINACKHANGRDWWIVVFNYYSSTITKLLLTPSGITSITTQSLGLPPHQDWAGQPQFSPDGTKFAYYWGHGSINATTNEIRLFDFDRCTGMFSNAQLLVFNDSVIGLGLSFSPNSKYLYFSTFKKIFQLNTDTTDVASSIDTVAINDGYAFPYNFTRTDFFLMYLAANGKIYISSGNSTIDFHYIDQPDSEGLACNVMQHALRLPCYSGRANVLHPNYYLGPVIGSVCDSLAHVGLQEHLNEVQNFSLMPNPVKDGIVQISYLLPQNENGVFEVFDLNGTKVYSLPLPPWSTLQVVHLPDLSGGVYQCAVRSGDSREVRKMVYVR